MGRFHLGEGITKKESDLAADVQEQQQALQAKAAERKDQPAAAPDAAEPQQPAVKVSTSHSFLAHVEHICGMQSNLWHSPFSVKE